MRGRRRLGGKWRGMWVIRRSGRKLVHTYRDDLTEREREVAGVMSSAGDRGQGSMHK